MDGTALLSELKPMHVFLINSSKLLEGAIKMGLFSHKKKLTAEEFVEGLSFCLKSMRARNIETMKMMLPRLIEKMNEDEIMKLAWELTILDTFNVTQSCQILMGDEQTRTKILSLFHQKVGENFMEISPQLVLAFKNESAIKYKTYHEAIYSSNPGWNLCKSVWENILSKPCESAVEMTAMSSYFNANQRLIADYIKGVGNKFEVASEWEIRWDLLDSLLNC